MRSFIIATLLSLSLLACTAEEDKNAVQSLPVQAVEIRARGIPNVVELPGRVEPVRVAEVRARVTGIVQRRLYEEGTDVREGQPLFAIDPSELRASYQQTEASLERARATAANARAVVNRYRPLVAENAISQQEFDAAVASAREASANVAQIEAELKSARLRLGYTTVRAPIAGRASRAQVTEGALVSQSEGTLLTRIEQISPVYVTFAQSAADMLELRRSVDAGEIDIDRNDRVEVRLLFSDGSEYPIAGHIDFLDFSVDQSTGTIELRAQFPNPEGLLLPGEFVRARIFVGTRVDGVTVPQRAVTMNEDGGTVFVIDKEGMAAIRAVKLGPMIDGQWVVQSGLKPGEIVITSNLQKLRDGMPVKRAPAEKRPGGSEPGTKRSGGKEA